jgi:hypothetical protein
MSGSWLKRRTREKREDTFTRNNAEKIRAMKSDLEGDCQFGVNLVDDILDEIAKLLDIKTLKAFALTSRRYFSTLSYHSVWYARLPCSLSTSLLTGLGYVRLRH